MKTGKETTDSICSCGCHDAAGFGGSCRARVGGGTVPLNRSLPVKDKQGYDHLDAYHE